MTASLAFNAGMALFCFVVGIMIGRDWPPSAQDRIDAAERRAARAIAALSDERAESAYWRDRVATPSALTQFGNRP